VAKSSKKLRILGGGLLAVAGFAGFAAALMYAAYYFMVHGDHSDLYHTTDMTPVTHVIGGRTFVIPKAYISYWRDWEPDDKNEFLTMEVLLPDMSPYNGTNAHLFDPRDPQHLEVDINLSDAPDGWTSNYDWIAVDDIALCTERESGFRICPGRFPIDDVLVANKGAKRMQFKCASLDNVPNPHCESYFPVVANVEMKIRYHRELMAQTEQIVAQTYRLVCGFFRPVPGEELEFDYCGKDNSPAAKPENLGISQ
jgi:hypothetical protein